MPRAVVAIGGNSLIKDPAHQTVEDQYEAASETTDHIAELIAAGWDPVIVHGNGPQVGFILRRSELSIKEVPPVPMDYAGADLQGALGYMFDRALRNEFRRRGIARRPVAVVTQTLTEQNGKTTLAITMRYDSQKTRDGIVQSGMATGMEASYDRLAGMLAQQPAGKA